MTSFPKRLERSSIGERKVCVLKKRLSLAILLAGVLFCSSCTGLLCTQDERAVLAEFPQYGGVTVKPESNIDTGACVVYYDAPAPSDQVQNYFNEQLAANGWTVEPAPPAGTLVEAQRGDFTYIIYFETVTSPSQETGTYLAVHVAQQ